MTLIASAHIGICVPDIEAAVAWYRDVLGMLVLSPPYLMSGDDIERDMGDMISGVSLLGAIVGFDSSDHVFELLEYPGSDARLTGRRLTDQGISHVGLVCDDLQQTRSELEAKGVHFLTSEYADIAGLRTAWFEDPYGTVFILMAKRRA